jgi:hypothetical protein
MSEASSILVARSRANPQRIKLPKKSQTQNITVKDHDVRYRSFLRFRPCIPVFSFGLFELGGAQR